MTCADTPAVPKLQSMTSVDQRPEVVDAALRDEIVLVGELVVAAAESDGHLSQSTIDAILGVEGPCRGRFPLTGARTPRRRS